MGDRRQEEREVRAARRQSLFRSVNERIDEVAPQREEVAETRTIACECASIDCTAKLEMTRAEYEEVRGNPRWFVVLPGHVFNDVERVVRETPTYVVVEKTGAGAAVAEVLDPPAR
jgi:hypothetical protein